MAHTFDPELQAAVGRMMAMAAEQGLSLERTPAARGDWRSLRAASEAALAAWEATAPSADTGYEARPLRKCGIVQVPRAGGPG
jgi:hypothetical protein